MMSDILFMDVRAVAGLILWMLGHIAYAAHARLVTSGFNLLCKHTDTETAIKVMAGRSYL